ncbi:MAG: hypothetical protein ACI8XW_002245 [Gammaproteobacteria bacterium]|jgi:hypothetical protein
MGVKPGSLVTEKGFRRTLLVMLNPGTLRVTHIQQ